jgi:hypothetical protein
MVDFNLKYIYAYIKEMKDAQDKDKTNSWAERESIDEN